MRVLRVTAYYAPAWVYGGPARSVLDSCRGLAELGDEVRVLTTAANGTSELDVRLRCPVDVGGVETRYYPRQAPRSLFHSPELYRAIRQQACEFDVVHCHAMMVPLGLFARRAAERAGIPYVLTSHGTLDPVVLSSKRLKKAAYLRLFERTNLERASAVIALTEQERGQIRRAAPRARAVVVPNGQPLTDLSRVPSRDLLAQVSSELLRRPYVLFMARLNWKKGLDLLVPAFARARCEHPEWMLVLAGPDEGGYRSVVEGLVARHGLVDSTVLPGIVDGERKSALLGNADLFALTSYSEGLPTAVVEALMAERPVVVTGTCYMPEIEAHGAGWVVDTSVDGVSSGLLAAMRDPDCRRERAARGRDLAAARYSRETVARRMHDLYRRCIDAPRGGDLDGF